MSLTFNDLEKRNLLVVSEDDIQSFMKNILNITKETIFYMFKTEATSKDIEEFLITNILENVEQIHSPQDVIFICEPTDGAYFWNVICNKHLISINSYTLDVENKTVKLYSTYEISIKDDDTCDILFKITDSLKNSELNDNKNLSTSEINTLLRLCWYTLTLCKKQSKM